MPPCTGWPRLRDIPHAKRRRLPVSSTRANLVEWSYRVSTGVLRLGIACRDEVIKQAQSLPIDVAGGVEVAIVMDTTRTCPCAIGQRQSDVDQSARAAHFGRREE